MTSWRIRRLGRRDRDVYDRGTGKFLGSLEYDIGWNARNDIGEPIGTFRTQDLAADLESGA